MKAFSRPGALTDREKTACAEHFVDIYSRAADLLSSIRLQIKEARSDGIRTLLSSHANFISTVIGDSEEGIQEYGLEATNFFEAITRNK